MENTNIKIAYDVNGNKIAKFQSITGRKGFSIKTNGNMPNLHAKRIGEVIRAHSDVKSWREFLSYVKEFGTDRQKSFFDM